MNQIMRLRRNRTFSQLHEPLSENILQTKHLIWPLFIIEGNGLVNPIKNFPGVFHYSIDTAIIAIKNANNNFGLEIFALFPVVDIKNKSEFAENSYSPNNLICRAIKEIKEVLPNILLITDVALDPYTLSGHDGIMKNNQIDNDKTVEILCKQALNQARAGSDVLAPSDMMDGRIQKIRTTLEEENFFNHCLLSYAAKYNTKLYSPFRGAMNVQRKQPIDKSSYQLNLANRNEAMREIELDIQEGSDIIMIKPALMCLDVILQATQLFNIPIFAYHVSGEYFLLKNAESNADFDVLQILYEQLLSIRRAGAKCIFTYGALEIAKFLHDKR